MAARMTDPGDAPTPGVTATPAVTACPGVTPAPAIDPGGGLYLSPVLYDVVNGPDTAREVTALERAAARFAARSGPGSVWLEPACGTGRYLRGLWRRGRHVAGYDPAAGMRAYATRRLAAMTTPHAATRRPGAKPPRRAIADAHFTTPAPDVARALGRLAAADVAICPVNSLRHLRDDPAALAHLAQVAALLRPGGVYLVGIDLLHGDREPEEDVWEAARGPLRVQQVIQYLPPEDRRRREQVVVELVVTRPSGTAHHGYTYDLRTYTARQWSRLVARSALRRVGVCDAAGREVPAAAWDEPRPYQIEVLSPRSGGPRGGPR